MPVPQADLGRVAAAHDRLAQAIEALTDDDMRRASLLPGWTAGHVLTHLARNADSHLRRADAACRGEVVDQYPGGPGRRQEEIEAGASRDAATIVEDVRRTSSRLDAAWRAVPPDAWRGRSRDANGQMRFLFELPARRWQEVEVHVVDLGIGITPAQWSEEFVVAWFPRTKERLWGALSPEARAVEFDDPADHLAWLYGRLERPDLPPLPSWG